MKISFLGTGTMGRAIISGLQKNLTGVSIIAYDKIESARANLGGNVTIAEPEAWFTADPPDAVIIAVKPADIGSALGQFADVNVDRVRKPLWISIAAGTTIGALARHLPDGARLCRVMPNTPALIGRGMSAYALADNCAEADKAIVETVFSACGKVAAVQEKLMNAVTGLSGSGPAYVFLFIESMIEAGIVAGLPRDIARACALQTVLGSAAMAAESADSLSDLMMKVMTPAGTTARGVTVLEQAGLRHTMIKAVGAAARRAEELEH
ncbi:MAG: pyrroline-5-carboxylate reductase [Chitinispirillaceae bacterium]|nr:pyrroline-5-carboxylate reductase [Chitinispirillaceae bacterium]